MLAKKINKWSIATLAVFAALLIGGAVSDVGAFSVDVKNLHYSDDSGRSILYDFSASPVPVTNNAIQLPEAAVTARGSGETGTTYFWGQGSPLLPAVTVTLDAAGQKATASPVDATTGGVAVLFAGGPVPAATGTTSWFYSLQLSNFNVDMTVQKAYEFDIGLGRDESTGPYNNATLNVVWVKGYYNGNMYPDNTLIIQARVQNGDTELWASTPIVRMGLDPAATTLMFDLSVDSGNHFFAAANISGEGMTNLGEYTLTTGQDSFQRMPDLFPYLYMGERSASTAPQATVQSFHFQGDGKYYASFYVQDPLHQAFAVRVTGNGNSYVGSGVDLTWNETSKSWYSAQSHEIGATPITSPWPSFTFTFTPQSGGAAIDPVTKAITGYVTEFAPNLQPSGSVSTNPVFTWTGITGASGYGVELNDGTTRIWNRYEIPATQTSVAYNGPALVNGKTYNYNILSNIEQNGVWNVSFANGSFTYTGTGGGTISFSGWVKTSPNWPVTDGMVAISGATVNALNEAGPPPFAFTTTSTDGSFSITGIPVSSTFRLVVPTPATTTYVPVLSKFMNWNADIQALLPFVLFSQDQYTAFGNPAGTGMILGRIALKSSPATFLSGAIIEAREWTPGNPPILGATYPVTYTSGSSTQADGIYMVKNVPAGKLVQLVATLPNHTFEFNYSVIPVQTGFISEESFFATAGSTAQVTTYSSEAAFTAAASNSTLINFEDRNTSSGKVSFAGNEYAGLGITFASSNGQSLWVYPPPTSSWTWLSKYLSPGEAPFESGDSNEDNLTLTFSPSVAAVGWTFLDMPNPFVVTIRVYDQSNGLIHEALNGTGIVVGVDGSSFWGILSPTTPIARVEIIDTANNGDDVAYDNFRFAATVTPATISFSGLLKDINDNPVSGATVEMVGNPAIYTPTADDGSFTLTGLPANTPFTIKMTKTGYVATYSSLMQAAAGTVITASRPFNLFAAQQLTDWGVAIDRGVIRGRVVNSANPQAGYISGATVSYVSSQGKTYRVKYEDVYNNLVDGSTTAKGRYYILDVVEGDTVTVSATQSKYTFPSSTTFITHDGAMSLGIVVGTAISGRVGIGGHIMNAAVTPVGIKNATIEQFGATVPINATTSNLDGSFYLSVPAATPLQVKFSKPQASPELAPTYSANMTFGADNLAIGDFNLFLKTKLSSWGIETGKGIIRGRVRDQASLTAYVGGATVTAQSALHPATPYAVCYDDACALTATDATTGRFIVKNVDNGDTVTVTAQAQGWSLFNTRTFHTYGNSVHQGGITGTPAAATTHPEAATIQTRFEAAMAAFNANNFTETGFASYVSAGYLDRGENKAMFVAEAEQERTAHGVKTWTIQSTLGSGDYAAMTMTWNDGHTDTMYFRKEGGVWLLYGNQKLFDVWANTGHQMYSSNQYPYWVNLQVKDPDSSLGVTISGVHVTGPGLPTVGIDLYHNTSDQQWHSWSQSQSEQDLGPKWTTVPPTPPLDYTFSISYTGGSGTSPEVQNFQVKTFVNDAPPQASLTPAAGSTATRPLIFSWGSAGTGYRYGVEVNDANGNRIWSAYDLTGTSVTYDGPALGGGQYNYNLMTQDAYWNNSMISTPFQMPILKGDLDGNGLVNLADAILAMKAVSGLTPTIRANYAASGADVNNDGKVGLQELLYILQYVAGLRQ